MEVIFEFWNCISLPNFPKCTLFETMCRKRHVQNFTVIKYHVYYQKCDTLLKVCIYAKLKYLPTFDLLGLLLCYFKDLIITFYGVITSLAKQFWFTHFLGHISWTVKLLWIMWLKVNIWVYFTLIAFIIAPFCTQTLWLRYDIKDSILFKSSREPSLTMYTKM